MEPRVVQRVLSPARAATRDRLIEAAIALATEGGYDAVGIRAVAAAAEVSVPTAYQHVSSKDELLVEALMTLGTRSTEALRRRKPRGNGPADRISRVFANILREAAQKPLLYRALYRAYVASGAELAAADGQVGYGPERAAWIGETLRAGDLGGHPVEDLDAAAGVLSCLFLGAMVGIATGRDPADVTGVLNDAVRRILH
ncbi:MAG TPA: TetR/AcrR family transcriptional regulator [Actinokineospora sp.]|jgi:AcrR family transcriptional regulator|nr:TetR/AcrR family transcriptional regulator [Actinokineospora sp.]